MTVFSNGKNAAKLPFADQFNIPRILRDQALIGAKTRKIENLEIAQKSLEEAIELQEKMPGNRFVTPSTVAATYGELALRDRISNCSNRLTMYLRLKLLNVG